ncbi:hypothetical protein ACQFYA_10565 [Promicromonospora sp. Marseille-Q5078]
MSTRARTHDEGRFEHQRAVTVLGPSLCFVEHELGACTPHVRTRLS